VAIRDYLLQRVDELYDSMRQPRSILDVGCGDGRLVIDLDLRYPGCAFGFDLPAAQPRCRTKVLRSPLAGRFDAAFRFGPAERSLPFPDRSMQLVVSNQVVEHVADLDAYFAGCARVLDHGGSMLCVFPPWSHPLEAHTGVPFAHWLPGGPARRGLIGASHRLRGVPRRQHDEDVARYWDRWLTEKTVYRHPWEVTRVAKRYFGRAGSDAAAYLQSLPGGSVAGRIPGAQWIPFFGLNACFVFSEPRPS
jgi:SAM-dependent methyltransferase